MGILAGYENFIGILGTGPLKYVENGDDFWLMVSSGLFKVIDGKLMILAEAAEQGSEINPEAAKRALEELEPKVSQLSVYEDEHKKIEVECLRAKARLEVYRRTNEVN